MAFSLAGVQAGKSQEVKVEKEKAKNPWGKIIFLVVFTLIIAVISWYTLAWAMKLDLSVFGNKPWSLFLRIILPILIFCFTIGLLSIDAVLIKDKKILLLTIFLTALTPFIFFYISIFSLIVFIVLFLAFLLYVFGVRKEKEERIKISFAKIMKVNLSLTLILFALAISLIFYFDLTAEKKVGENKSSEMLASSTASIVNLILETQVKDYQPDMTLDEFMLTASTNFLNTFSEQLGGEAQNQTEVISSSDISKEIKAAIKRGEIKESDLPPGFMEKLNQGTLTGSDIVESQTTQIFAKQLGEARDEFLKSLGVEAKGSDKISDVIKNIITTKMSEGLSPFEKWIPPVLAVSLFLVLIIFNFLYAIITKILALLVFMILHLFGFFKIYKVQKEAESIELT